MLILNVAQRHAHGHHGVDMMLSIDGDRPDTLEGPALVLPVEVISDGVDSGPVHGHLVQNPNSVRPAQCGPLIRIDAH